MVGQPIHQDAALVLEKLGGDTSGFAARQLTPRIASDADLVLAMTRAHRDIVLQLAPRQLARTFTLNEAARLASEGHPQTVADLARLRPQFAGRELPDIADPIGQPKGAFETVGSQIAELLAPIIGLCKRSSAYAVDE
jgi:protein-tyrosine phosphatase